MDAGVIDLRRYPILSLDTREGRSLLASCRRQLDDTGCCELPGFLTKEATDRMAAEVAALDELAYRSRERGNSYLVPDDPSLPEDHPKRIAGMTSVGVVAYDQIPLAHGIRKLYEWDGLLEFIRRAIHRPELYRYADELGALNLAYMREGDELRWHFDQTDFVTSLTLQAPEAGGEFEYYPLIRTPEQENFDKVGSLLRGDRAGIVHVPMTPGTLVLFEGRYSIHRVAPVRGKRSRVVALLGYDTRPGVRSSEHLHYIRYGRTPQADLAHA